MDMIMILAVALAGAAGGWLGWRIRGMRHLTERRVLEEIFTRKTRLAETERDVAVGTLDAAKLEARTNDERYQLAAADVARLEEELARANQSIEVSNRNLGQVETRLTSVLEVQAARQAELENAVEERKLAAEMRRRAEIELEETRNLMNAELDEAREGLASRTREIGDLTLALAERDAEISRLQAEIGRRDVALEEAAAEEVSASEELDRRATAIRERDERIAELEPLVVELEDSRRGAGALDAQLGKKSSQLETAQTRLRELEPLVGKLEEATRSIDALEDKLAKRNAKLEAAEARLRELEPLVGELDKATRQVAALEEKLEKRTDKLQSAEARAAELEKMPAEVEKAQKHAEVLHQRWEKKVAKLEVADEKIGSLKDELDAAKAAVADRDKQIAALAASHKTIQLKLDQARRHVEDLQASSSERAAKLKELQARFRDQATTVKSLESQLKRTNGPVRPAKTRTGRSKPAGRSRR